MTADGSELPEKERDVRPLWGQFVHKKSAHARLFIRH